MVQLSNEAKRFLNTIKPFSLPVQYNSILIAMVILKNNQQYFDDDTFMESFLKNEEFFSLF